MKILTVCPRCNFDNKDYIKNEKKLEKDSADQFGMECKKCGEPFFSYCLPVQKPMEK